MHRDRIRFLLKERRQMTLTDATEVERGLPAILAQLDAAQTFLSEQSEENRKTLERLLKEH